MASAQGASTIGPGGPRQSVLCDGHVRGVGTGFGPRASPGAREPGPSAAAKAVLALVDGYRRFLSPLLPRACRFSPSCSEYARLAILKHGFVRGTWRSLGRLLRCHPFHPGGVDLP